MVNTINNLLALNLLGGGASGSGVSASMLTSWAAAKAGIGVDVSKATIDPNSPLAPVWQPGISPSAEALVQRAFDGKSFFDTNAKLYSDLGAQGDYKRLFALYSGVSTLQALAGTLGDEKMAASTRARTEAQFQRGLEELHAFFASQNFEDMRLAQGDRMDEAQTSLAIARTSEDYVTAPIHKGSITAAISGLDPNAKFDIVALSSSGTERRVSIDLAQMGSTPRSLSNVVGHINAKLASAGAMSRLAVQDVTPKTSTIVLGGRTIEQPYKGLKSYALKVDVRGGEQVTFDPVGAKPALYVVGGVVNGARLIKLEDVADAPGQTALLDRPGATADPIGANVATGWYGAGAPYNGRPDEAWEQRTNALMSAGANNFEDLLRDPGEAVLKLTLADGRAISVSTGWRAEDLEAWRALPGESGDKAILNDLSERLTQLLHEQGVAAGVDVWEDGDNVGLSIFTGDLVTASSFTISGRSATLTPGDDPVSGMVGGLRGGVYARSFELGDVIPNTELFYEDITFNFSTAGGGGKITIDGGEDGITGAELITQLNDQLREKFIPAFAELVDDGASYSIRINGLHDLTSVSGEINEASHSGVRVAPNGAVAGGLPLSGPGDPFGDAVRTYDIAGGSPLLMHTGALDIQIVVATASGNKTVSVSVSAAERLADPDVAPGEWSAAFQARLDDALNAAGLYLGALDSGLSQWGVAENAGQRIASISINGDALALEAQQPAAGLGGAFSVERSFTSANAATGVADPVAALVGDPNVSITFSTPWGEKTVSAALEAGDPRTLEAAALRLNEALAAQGYDLGVEATALSGGGAGLRIVTGASHTIRDVQNIALGATDVATTLDPIDSQSRADDPVGALSVAERAARGAAVSETIPALNTLSAPSASTSGWFPGRAFDVSVGGESKVAAARAVQAGADGSVYVLADLSGDSASVPIKGARDVALLKYDSAGKLVFSRVLGAADEASGYALAVAADGKVAVAGAVKGALTGAGMEKGGTDSFVAVYDAKGDELWTARRGASANDEVRAVAFAPDGGVIVAGKTDSALGASVALGGADGYVRGFSASGLETFTRQFGTSGVDAATALAVRDNGAGGIEIYTGGVENNRGVLRSFTYSSSGGVTVGATRDIGNFYKGAINALALDGAALYVGGEIGADRLSVGGAAQGAVAGQEGFVARVSVNLAANTLDRTSYVGSAKDDAVTGLAIVGDDVYATGQAGGVIAGSGGAFKSAFVARLDGEGDIDWMRTFNSSAGALTPTGIAVDASGVSALDALGLPRGKIGAADSNALVDRSALKVGDEFSIGGLDRRMTRITITATDTMSTLLAKINRALGGEGRATLERGEKGDSIKIVARDGSALRMEAGRENRDALGGLGLSPGVIGRSKGKRGEPRTFGLGIVAADLKLKTKEDIAKTKAELSAAISIIRQAYDAILNPNAKELTEAEKALEARRNAAGVAPEYYTQQLANYRAALARLGG